MDSTPSTQTPKNQKDYSLAYPTLTSQVAQPSSAKNAIFCLCIHLFSVHGAVSCLWRVSPGSFSPVFHFWCLVPILIRSHSRDHQRNYRYLPGFLRENHVPPPKSHVPPPKSQTRTRNQYRQYNPKLSSPIFSPPSEPTSKKTLPFRAF
jgi:hypothetical protein